MRLREATSNSFYLPNYYKILSGIKKLQDDLVGVYREMKKGSRDITKDRTLSKLFGDAKKALSSVSEYVADNYSSLDR